MAIPVTSNIIAGGSTFAATDISQVKGALQIVADNTARDAILASVRQEGQSCYITSTGKTYQLIGGIANGNWVEKTIGIGTGRVILASVNPTVDPGVGVTDSAFTVVYNAGFKSLWIWTGAAWLQLI
jgi:hypothetical protein